MRLTMTMTLGLLVTGCATVGPVERSQVCAGWEPISGEARDVDLISDTLAVSIDAHNRQGANLGCWE